MSFSARVRKIGGELFVRVSSCTGYAVEYFICAETWEFYWPAASFTLCMLFLVINQEAEGPK